MSTATPPEDPHQSTSADPTRVQSVPESLQPNRPTNCWHALRWGRRPGGPPLSRATFLRWGSAGILGLAVPSSFPGWLVPRAAAADPITVDLSDAVGTPEYRATGFLHGLNQDGTMPPDDLLVPLKPQLFRGGGSTLPGGGWSKGGRSGYQVRWQNVLDRFHRVTTPPLHAEYAIVLADLWGANGVDIKPTDPYPGDDGDWNNYETFIRQLMADYQAAGMQPDQVQFEIWNEPDYNDVYWPRPKTQYEEMWQHGVRLIRSIDPQARIEGPTFTRITVTESSWHMDDFLDMTTATDTNPDILSWHDLIPGRDPVNQAALARQLLSERGLTAQLEINEYPAGNGLDPGYNSWYVARLERAGIDYAALAIFGPCCMYPQLDGLLISHGSDLVRADRWWVYQRYASITGRLVKTLPTATVDAVAGFNSDIGQARILLGNARGDGTDLGTVPIMVTGIDAAKQVLDEHGRVPTRIERIPNTGELSGPEVIKDLALSVRPGDPLTVNLDWTDSNAGYVITLGRQDSHLPPLVIAGVSPNPVLLLPGEPTQISIVLRNYSDKSITVQPQLTAPAGYTVSDVQQIDVPANGDATSLATITRDQGTADAGQLTITAHQQTATVQLQPTDNWARIATFTASSTHPPSSPANLNDGDTDSDHWGGGGAGGWNDDTANSFPDTVTATWNHQVQISRVRFFTLNSAAYPASAWGVRDIDVRTHSSTGWQTAATVRGNTAGIVDATFPAASIDQLQLVILDSNDHAYSRLLEVEAYT